MALRFYPDTNIVHELCSTLTPAEFDAKAKRNDIVLCLGHQTYELARSFLYNHSQEDVQKAFAFLAEIQSVEYLPDVNKSIEAEAHLAETGMFLVTVVGPFNQVAARQEMLRLAKGHSDIACDFIAKRERNISLDKIRITGQNQSAADKAKAMNKERTRKIKTFELLQKELAPERPGWLARFLQKKGHSITQTAIHRILANPDKYPLINTIINTQEYLYFITGFHRSVPGKDTLDDFRHLVESSLADVFVTKDEDLLSQASKTRPYKKSLHWQDFASDFNSTTRSHID